MINCPYNKYDLQWNRDEIRMRKDHFIMATVAFVFLTVLFVALKILIDSPLYLLIIFGALAEGHIVLSYVNEKILFDETGLTVITFLGRSEHFAWDDVTVSDRNENTRMAGFRGVPVRVLELNVRSKNGRTYCLRYPFRKYIGVSRFINFYTEYFGLSHISEN